MQRVIITGASSGIGTALAHHYARNGAVLGLIARRKSALEELAAQLSTPVQIYAADVRDAAALQADEMVVVSALIQLKDRLVSLKMVPDQQTGLFELRQHAVNGSESGVRAVFQHQTIDIFSR